jgi:hypothetical protein
MTTPESSDPLNSETKIRRIAAGGGRITLAVHGTKAVFEDLSAAYPLKLLSPRIHEERVGVVYLMSYGGGLVGGDRVELEVLLKANSCLLVLSQVGFLISSFDESSKPDIFLPRRVLLKCLRRGLDNDWHLYDRMGLMPRMIH